MKKAGVHALHNKLIKQLIIDLVAHQKNPVKIAIDVNHSLQHRWKGSNQVTAAVQPHANELPNDLADLQR